MSSANAPRTSVTSTAVPYSTGTTWSPAATTSLTAAPIRFSRTATVPLTVNPVTPTRAAVPVPASAQPAAPVPDCTTTSPSVTPLTFSPSSPAAP